MNCDRQKSETAMKPEDLLTYFLFALSAIAVLPLVAWVLISPYGSELLLCVTMLYHIAFLAAVVMLPSQGFLSALPPDAAILSAAGSSYGVDTFGMRAQFDF